MSQMSGFLLLLQMDCGKTDDWWRPQLLVTKMFFLLTLSQCGAALQNGPKLHTCSDHFSQLLHSLSQDGQRSCSRAEIIEVVFSSKHCILSNIFKIKQRITGLRTLLEGRHTLSTHILLWGSFRSFQEKNKIKKGIHFSCWCEKHQT